MSFDIDRARILLYGAKRKVMWNLLARRLGLVLLSEYPKSGGTWYAKMLCEYFELPFFRNTTRPSLTRTVLNGHEHYKPYTNQLTTIVRDGRDVMVSLYHHMLLENERNHHASVRSLRENLKLDQSASVADNLPKFIQYIHEDWATKPRHFTWSEFTQQWCSNLPDEQIVRYENLLNDPYQELSMVIKALTGEAVDKARLEAVINNNNFQKLSGRSQGSEAKGSFLRKGIAGDWKNHFNPESAALMQQYAGAQLIALGYESNDDWVDQV